jgi:hypothetical protein
MPEYEVTPSAIAANLAHLGRELAAMTDGLGDLEHRSVTAREDYVLAHAKAVLKSSGTVDERKAQALVDTHDERLSAETADALVRQRRAQIATLKVRVDIGRSVGSIVKSEIELDKVR